MQFESCIEQKVQRDLYRYWERKRTGSILPGRSDIHPEDVVRLLPHIGLIDVLANNQYRYRLIGTEMVSLFQKDFTGMKVTEAKKGQYGEVLTSLYADAVTRQCAIYSRSMFLLRGDVSINVSRLILPLSHDKKTVDMILFSTIPIWDEDLAAKTPIFEQPTRVKETSRIIEKQLV